MSERSVKGVILQRSWSQLNELLEAEKIEREALVTRLEPEDVRILDEKVEPSLWYPIGTVTRFSCALGELVDEEGSDIWIERGLTIIRNVLQSPNFKSFVEGALKQDEEQVGRTLMGMAGLLLNFGQMRFEGNFNRFEVIFSDVPDLPEVVRYAIQGAIRGLGEFVVDGAVVVESRKRDASTIVYWGGNAAMAESSVRRRA